MDFQKEKLFKSSLGHCHKVKDDERRGHERTLGHAGRVSEMAVF